MSIEVGSSPSLSLNFQKLVSETFREAILEPKDAEWCASQSFNERILKDKKLFVEFLGERAYCSTRHDLNAVALVYITHPESGSATEEDPNLHYFIDIRGRVLLQTVPYPYGLRQIDDKEIGELAQRMTKEDAA